jgi:hypothetical protein
VGTGSGGGDPCPIDPVIVLDGDVSSTQASAPFVLAVDDDARVLRAVSGDLRPHYAGRYRSAVMAAACGALGIRPGTGRSRSAA